jgi:CelD/BcsL family acetyltransferase involved in cellulose biosynthesis
MLARKNFLDSGNVLTTPRLIRDMPGPLKPKIVLARHEGKPVVGAAIVFAGDTAHYLFGASDDSMLPLKGGYALQWWVIDWLRREGFKWYDLGGESLSDGLRQFKRGLVGKQGCVLEGNIEYEYDGSVSGRMAAEVIFAIRSAKRAYMKYLNR